MSKQVSSITSIAIIALLGVSCASSPVTTKAKAAMDRDTFYSDRSGVHYAQSRYPCYYLQEKELLVKFYQQFRARHKDDPSGFRTLQAVLGENDMDRFQRKWERFVLGLSR